MNGKELIKLKKLIFGMCLISSGIIGITVLCAGAMCSQFTINGSNNFIDIFNLFGVTKVAAILLIIIIIGLVFAVFGFFEKND